MTVDVNGRENAAPSVHLSYYFPSADAILKMQKIKIVQSAFASFFQVNSFPLGYTGLQQTPDTSYGKSNIIISSLWDPDTAGGIYSVVDYNDPRTFKSRFDKEGDGWKTIYPYDWMLNTWYNIVNRAWESDSRLYIGTFINNISTGKWIHTATLSIPYQHKYLSYNNDAFLENWYGCYSSCDGRFIRKALFKDCWNLTINGVWRKNTHAHFSANKSAEDIQRNGIYHNSFNAYYDDIENAYCMQHGGGTIQSAAFNGGRELNLPAQRNQETTPSLTTATITSITASNSSGITNINWVVDDSKSPQLGSKIEIINAQGIIVITLQDTLPQRRNFTVNKYLDLGQYSVRLTITDIFNQPSFPLTANFIVSDTPY